MKGPELPTEREELPEAVEELTSQGARLLGLVATDDREKDGVFHLRVILEIPGHRTPVLLRSSLPANDPRYPSLTPFLPAAHWEEREIHDLFGLQPEGHPDKRPLVLPPDWPTGLYPLRRDFHGPAPTGKSQPFEPRMASGEGVGYLPVGPIHAGIIDSGHFFFSTVGETILQMDLRLFWKHRGVEKLLEGQSPNGALRLVSRLSAAHSFSHQVALAQAWETLGDIRVPERASYLRTIFLELERLCNHLNDIGAIAAGTAFAVASQRGAALKEKLLRLNHRLTGHRYLFDLAVLGGLGQDLSARQEEDLRHTLREVRKEWESLLSLLLGHSGFQERLTGVGIVTAQVARDLGALGPVARASGLSLDVRRDHPYAAYPLQDLTVPTLTTGDVWARTEIRSQEVASSFALIQELLNRLPEGPVDTPIDTVPSGQGLSMVESPQGAALHWIAVGPDGRLTRARLRPAPLANWPLLMEAVRENAIGDFPLINKSFELCYASNDR